MKLVLALATLALMASTAYAQPTFTIEGVLGFGAEAEHDGIKSDAGTGDSDDEDIESNFGVQATADFPVSGKLRAGGRVAFIVGEGDDSDGNYQTITGDGYLRYPVLEGSFGLSLMGGAGVTRMSVEDFDAGIAEVDGDGIGLHFFAGARGEFALTPTIDVVVGLYYDRHMVNVEGTEQGVDFEFEDGVLSRFLLAGGVAF